MSKSGRKSVTIDEASTWLEENRAHAQTFIDDAIDKYRKQNDIPFGIRSLADKMEVSPIRACVLKDQSRGLSFTISYRGHKTHIDTRMKRVHFDQGKTDITLETLANKIPSKVSKLWDSLMRSELEKERSRFKMHQEKILELFEKRLSEIWEETDGTSELHMRLDKQKNGYDAYISRYGIEFCRLYSIGRDLLKPYDADTYTKKTKDLDIDKACSMSQEDNDDGRHDDVDHDGEAISDNERSEVEKTATAAIKKLFELIDASKETKVIGCSPEAVRYSSWAKRSKIPHISSSLPALNLSISDAEKKIEAIAYGALPACSDNDIIVRQSKVTGEQVSATFHAYGDIIVCYMSKSGQVNIKVASIEEQHDTDDSVVTFAVEVERNDKIATAPSKAVERAVKQSELFLKQLSKKGYTLKRNTGAGLISGKGDFTLERSQKKKGLRRTLKTKHPEKDYTAWKNGVRDFIDDICSSFDEETDKAEYADTLDALEYIHNFVERDIAYILSHVDYMAVESLAPYLSGEKYWSAYPPYRPDLYDAKYKGFYTQQEIKKIIEDMNSRNIIRTRFVDYRNHCYTRVNSLKASRKAEILAEKKYKFPLDELLEKCKDKDVVLDDFECEYLFWDIEAKAGTNDENTEGEALDIPDYLMLMKMLDNPSFIAEYRKRYVDIMKGAPDMFATLLKVKRDQQGKTGMKAVITEIIGNDEAESNKEASEK